MFNRLKEYFLRKKLHRNDELIIESLTSSVQILKEDLRITARNAIDFMIGMCIQNGGELHLDKDLIDLIYSDHDMSIKIDNQEDGSVKIKLIENTKNTEKEGENNEKS